MQIDTYKAFRSIYLHPSGMQRLVESANMSKEIDRYKIDRKNFSPVIKESIEIEDWVAILAFYSRYSHYEPAREIIKALRKILRSKNLAKGKNLQ